MTFRARMAMASLLLFAASFASRPLLAQVASPDIAAADAAFQAGKFSEAEKLYTEINAKHPKDYSALVELARIAMFSNRLKEAETLLQRVMALKSDSVEAKLMLAEVFYRRDDFGSATASLRGLDMKNDKYSGMYTTLNLPKLEEFSKREPNRVEGSGPSTRLKFVKTDPLPLVRVTANGKEAVFFIDTGGAEVILDPDFAREIGTKSVGAVQGSFATGQEATLHNGRLDSLKLGDWVVKDVPVQLLNTRRFSEAMGVKQVDGCIGTILLYHFLSTIDYAHGELVLRRNTADGRKQMESQSAKNVALPFWMAGDHYLLAEGRVMTQPPALFFVDTGLAGGGVNLPESVIKQAGIKIDSQKATAGMGGGGSFQTVPYTVPLVSLGEVTRRDVPALFDGPVSWEHAWGFYVGALIGHDFFRPYALTFDFVRMQIVISTSSTAL
jgi:predicted aspartyl protease